MSASRIYHVDKYVTLIIVPIVSILAIQKFCYIGWLRSIIATVLFTAWLIVWPILFAKIVH
jgi:hypothetical protein